MAAWLAHRRRRVGPDFFHGSAVPMSAVRNGPNGMLQGDVSASYLDAWTA